MFKRIILSCTAIGAISLLLFSGNIPQPKFNPDNAVFAWDFHDVLVQKDWTAMTNQMLSIVKKDWRIVGLLFWPPFWKDLYNAYYSCSAAEELLKQIMRNYPILESHQDDLLILINLHKPISESVEILKQMKNRGYRNYLASNIGRQSYEIAKKRFPYIFDQFIGSYFPNMNNQKNGNSTAKPCLDYYLGLRNYFASQGIDQHTTIIFIDDRYENIQGAINSNHKELNPIYGIHFQSPSQLKKFLAKIAQ